MPNWCSNELTVYGEKEELQKFLNKVQINDINSEEALSFAVAAPIPEEFRDKGWYEWCIENWGTKWDAQEVRAEEIDPEQEYLKWFFETAWSPPVAWLTKIATMFPTLSIRLKYEEEGAGFMGVAKAENGKVKDNYIDL